MDKVESARDSPPHRSTNMQKRQKSHCIKNPYRELYKDMVSWTLAGVDEQPACGENLVKHSCVLTHHLGTEEPLSTAND